MITLFAHKITPRLRYTSQTIFTERLGLELDFTENLDNISSLRNPVISYGQISQGALSIPAIGLLDEDNIRNTEPSIEKSDGDVFIFRCGNEDNSTPFDLFSSVFYMLSRYEEYLPYDADQHGRFAAGNAWAVKNGLEMVPLVDKWIGKIGQLLRQKFPSLNLKKETYNFIPTIDIDNAWAFQHKPCYKQAGGIMRSLLKREFDDISLRMKVIRGRQQDPYDSYEYIFDQHKSTTLPLFFFLMSNKGGHDKNLSPRNRHFVELIKNLSDRTDIGIHPSYCSFLDENLVQHEIYTLEKITGKRVTKSRQHFLKMSLPHSYRILEQCGIKEDYTMGFAEQPGFRAGTTHPFRFFDLGLNRETSLKIFPLTLMEGTLRDYQKLEPQQAKEYIKELAGTTKKYNGSFVSLWHNESLGDWKRWKGWREVYSNMVEQCRE